MRFRDWIAISASLAGLVTFLIGFAATQEATIALGVVGVLYFVSFPVIVWLVDRDVRRAIVAGGLPIALAGYLFLIRPVLDRFGFLQFFGLLALLLAITWAAVELDLRRRAKLKACPDCLSDVPKEARVCRWCGFEFFIR
jgi:hypothetical protein